MKHTLLTALLLASFVAAPTVRAQAPEIGAESPKPKAKTGATSAAFCYRPEGMTMWDPWFFAQEGQVHLSHLQRLATGSKRTAAEADHISHAVTRDLIHSASPSSRQNRWRCSAFSVTPVPPQPRSPLMGDCP
jgi:hypothetical protein